jgi:ankyrin repeat protein
MRIRAKYFVLIVLITLALLFVVSNKIAWTDENLNQSFFKAVSAKDFSLMEKLLKEGADINATESEGKFTALTEAAGVGDLELVNYLLQKGAKAEGVQTFPNSPIYFAIIQGNIAIVKRFLDLGISSNYTWPDRGGTLLTAAVDSGHLDIVELLVQRGADVNFRGSGNYGTLYRAIFSDYFEVFKFLLSKGACLNERDKAALSEMEWEKDENNKKYIQLLKKHKECKNNK